LNETMKSRYWATLFDTLAVSAAGPLTLFFGKFRFEEEILFWLFLILVANVIWLPARLFVLILRLADRPWREQLALTFIPEQQYLWRKIRWPLFRALLPSITAAPILLIFYLWISGLPYDLASSEIFIGFGLQLIFVAALQYAVAALEYPTNSTIKPKAMA